MKTIQQRFEHFNEENPHVYEKLVFLARSVKNSGFEKYGIGSLYERLRWHYQFDVATAEQFKLSDNYRSRYARRIMAQEPDLREFFRTRPLRAL